jgi:lipase
MEPIDASLPVIHRFGRLEPSAPTLVLLHGLTDSGRCWGDAVARWGGTYRILALDALGHGESRRFTAAELDAAPGDVMYRATVATLERELAGSPRPVLVGHSMGGLLATALLARRPDLARAAVLEDPAWVVQRREPVPHGRAAERLAERERFAADLEGALADGRAEHPAWPESEMRPWAEAKVATDPAFLAADAMLVSEPWPDLVRAIARPALVVTGTDNTIVAQCRDALDAIANPSIKVAVVRGAGHCVRRDDGVGYHAVVDPWIAAQFGAEGWPGR